MKLDFNVKDMKTFLNDNSINNKLKEIKNDIKRDVRSKKERSSNIVVIVTVVFCFGISLLLGSSLLHDIIKNKTDINFILVLFAFIMSLVISLMWIVELFKRRRR